MSSEEDEYVYWKEIWKQFLHHKLGTTALIVTAVFCIMGIYAPFLASSKPIFLIYEGTWYFPLFRYLLFQGFYTKYIDLFFNLLALTFPVFLLGLYMLRRSSKTQEIFLLAALGIQLVLFAILIYFPLKDPAYDTALIKKRELALQELKKQKKFATWQFDLQFLNEYGKLDQILRYHQLKDQHQRIVAYGEDYISEKLKNWLEDQVQKQKTELVQKGTMPERLPSLKELQDKVLQETPKSFLQKVSAIPTLWQIDKDHEETRIETLNEEIKNFEAGSSKNEQTYQRALNSLEYTLNKRNWLIEQEQNITFELMPLFRPLHWEDDAGGEQNINQFLPWWELTRINRKDLVAALIFGVRISLVVGILAVSLALIIGIPIGSFAGYYGGTFDIIVSRLMEIWESMPTFFMLLLVVAITQSKSIFIVIAVVGIFGWTSFSRYIRGEFFKHRNLPYVEACHALGFKDSYIMFSHILPNAIPPVLTLLPFAVLGAITSEAGLSFLGLGEEGSCSWGVLMDEGRSAFPGESYLLWPPALLLTILLVAIALVGDALRDVLDPKMHK
jgi:peptide/nickel transport system permease protein